MSAPSGLPFTSFTKMGLGTISGGNKSYLLSDQSSSSRIERVRKDALLKYKQTQPTSGPVKNETEKNSRLDALNRVRAGGYVPSPKVLHSKDRVTVK